MPTRVDVDEGMAPRELLDRRLLVGETVVAQVAVAVVVSTTSTAAGCRRDCPTSITMNPNCASDWLLLRGLNVLVTLSVCGPG